MIISVLSHPKSVENELETILFLLENGVDTFHIRKPNLSRKQTIAFIENFPKKHWDKFVLHHHYSLVFKMGLKGIHLNRKKKKSPFLTKLLLYYFKLKLPEMHISTSFSNLSSLFEDNRKYNYVFLSPVFDSISKSGYQSSFSHHNLKAAMDKTKHKVLALGGVRADKIQLIRSAGFSGMVLSGILWEESNPIEVFKEIKKLL